MNVAAGRTMGFAAEGALTSRLASLVAARVCHDLGGAVAGLAALVPEAADAGARAMLAETSTELRLRLRLYAVLFGLPDEIGWEEVAALLPGAPMAHRVRFALSEAPNELALGLARPVLAALLLAAEALPRGGVVRVTPTSLSGIAFRPEGREVAWSPTLLALLQGAPLAAALAEGPRQVLAPWLMLLAAEAGWSVSLALPAGAGEPALHLAPGA